MSTLKARDVAQDVAEFTCDLLTSRSLSEKELLAVRDVCGEMVADYGLLLVKDERNHVLDAIENCLVCRAITNDDDVFRGLESLISTLRSEP